MNFRLFLTRVLSTSHVNLVDKKCSSYRSVSARRFISVVVMVIAWALSILVQAETVQHLATQTATASGAGAAGTPSIASFTIPSGKNRVLFIWSSFERDHCSPADESGGRCTSGNVAGTGLGDNWPEPRTGTPPATTTNNQITARVVGVGGTVDKKNALVVGGTPSGDTRFINISSSPSGSPAGTAFFSVSSFHIVLFENEINALLGGAASGTVSIALPDVTLPSNAGDDAMMVASVFQNVEQTPTGFVRNATATAQVSAGTPGNFTLAPAAYDAGQLPDEADDGKLVMATSSSVSGFTALTGHTALATLSVTNSSGTFDTPNGNLHNEPNGFTGVAYFRNGGATPGSLYTLQSAGAAAPLVYGGTNASFLLESDNADMGDAPVSYGNPSHTLSGIRLGASVDADATLLNNATATGDDTNNTDDENGVTLVSLLPTGETTIVPISVQGAGGFLNAWFDWNADGDFNDAGEQMATNQAVVVGSTNLSVAVPATAIVGSTFARFRVCTNNTATDNCATPTTTVQSGEVEDYQFSVSRKLTLRKVTSGSVGGPFGFSLTNTVQTSGSVTTTAVNTPTQVDGDTTVTGTQVFTISSPTTAVTINENTLPSGWTLSGATCVNASSAVVGSLSGSTYTITGAEIAASTSFTCTFSNRSPDYGDAPDAAATTAAGNYRTTLADGGPSHSFVAGLSLGALLDADSGALQNASADADDTNGLPDDEDAIASFLPLSVTAGQTYLVAVDVTNTTGNPAYLVGYLDFNKDGDFLDSGEQSATLTVNASGSQSISFTTPAGMTTGITYARFRLASVQSQAESSVGAATGGEVEDYQVSITTAAPTTLTVTGSVWNDADGSITVNGGEAGTNAGGLTLYVVDGSGNVVDKATVAANGGYTLSNVPVNLGLTLRLSSDGSVAVGSPAPAASLPTGWVNTGENKNGVTETITPGEIALTTTTVNVVNQNFGIEQLPTATGGSATSTSSTGSAVNVPSSLFSGSDPDGTVVSYTITSLPAGADSITINGTIYDDGNPLPPGGVVVAASPGGGFPSGVVSVVPQAGVLNIVIPFIVTDNAAKTSAAANATLLASIAGSVWEDLDGDILKDISEVGTNGDSSDLTLYLVTGANVVAAKQAVLATGLFSFYAIPSGSYDLILVDTASVAVGDPAPDVSLPVLWSATGESTGNAATGSSDGNADARISITVP
jgi:hypothetical protein